MATYWRARTPAVALFREERSILVGCSCRVFTSVNGSKHAISTYYLQFFVENDATAMKYIQSSQATRPLQPPGVAADFPVCPPSMTQSRLPTSRQYKRHTDFHTSIKSMQS